jgi:hypothetical protein
MLLFVFFVLILLGSIFQVPFAIFFLSKEHFHNSLVLVRMLRMVLLNASIAIFLKLLVLL